MRYAFAITKWNGHFLPQTLESLPDGVEILVVDNKANNWPLSRGWNHGIETLLANGCDAVIVMNDDVILRHDTGALLADGLLGGHDPGWTDKELLLLSARHAAPSDARTNEADWGLLEFAKPEFQPGPDFACFCVDRRLFEIIGKFDENFAPCWYEDNDMHRRIQLAGYEAGAYAPYWHFLNGTIRSDPERQAAAHMLFGASQRYYAQKWGAPDDGRSPLGRETFLTPFGR